MHSAYAGVLHAGIGEGDLCRRAMELDWPDHHRHERDLRDGISAAIDYGETHRHRECVVFAVVCDLAVRGQLFSTAHRDSIPLAGRLRVVELPSSLRLRRGRTAGDLVEPASITKCLVVQHIPVHHFPVCFRRP